jgi:hypothetical protein
MSDEKMVEVTDPKEMLAVGDGEIEGETYEDGEVWANAESLRRWRVEHAS